MRRPVRRRRLLVASALLLVAAAPAEPPGYREGDYGAAVPATLRGARVLTTGQAHALWLAGAVFIDVLPLVPRPEGLPDGTLWRQRPHEDIPGSVWLPDTGYGALAPAMADYFARGLQEATGGDRDRPLVVYCKPSCWMSWNAAKRAVALGYTQVGWYPEGTAGWHDAGYPLETREPKPRPAK